jgi:purine-nucleoside phosphorylase
MNDNGAVTVATAARHLAERIEVRPEVGLILGSGLGGLADELEPAVRIGFGEIPGFARPAVEGHAGVLAAGLLEGVPCIALQGRYHLYEGHSAQAVVFPVRTMIALGVQTLIVTNAAGAVRRTLSPGDLMLIDDHINLTGHNPLVGPVREGEVRFPDMSRPYDRRLQELAGSVAAEQGLRLERGVYCALLGPSYETPAEVRMCERLGADVVGMSTVPEVLAARAAGIRVLGITLVSNAAAGLSPVPLSHDEVVEAGRQARGYFGNLVRGVLRRLHEAPAS